MSRLVVVSNRVPTKAGAGAGGLAVALDAALEEAGGLWFGWSGEIAEAPSDEPRVEAGGPYEFARLDLSPAEHEAYYEQHANRTLWPLFHNRLDLASFDHAAHDTYLSVNRRFARALAPLLGEDETVWVHDYHLVPLGRELRGEGVRGPIGFFLHIPFPPAQLLEALPWATELIEQLCSYDLLGFQTQRHLDNFREAAARLCGARLDPGGGVTLGGARTLAGAFPIGIDTADFARRAASPQGERRVGWLGRRMSAGALLIGVDRLDYTKGLVERFEAFERLLEDHPRFRERVTLLQIAAPSREGIAEYQAMQSELESLTGHINGRFGAVDWTPVHYMNRYYSHEQLAALFRFCRVGLVTPLCDGMNLVAKEYLAAQDPEDPGVLILSRFAGAAEGLADALIVNPYDREETADAIRQALEMPLAERRERWERMMSRLRRYDVHAWRRDFLDRLAEAGGREEQAAPPRRPGLRPVGGSAAGSGGPVG
ncbi:MAG: alpha,alpha-trehalose-phosphate synthase (UDP-forming) [Pseudomonadota bacterium]